MAARSREPRTCPKCGLLNPPTAQVCQCGYDFSAKSGPTGQGTIAGFWRRFGAFFIDALALGLVGQLLGFILELAVPNAAYFRVPNSWGTLTGLLVGASYFTLLESGPGRGKSLGKHLLRIKLVRQDGSILSAPQAFLRSCIWGVPSVLNGARVPIVPSVWAGLLLSLVVFGFGLSLIYFYVFNGQTRQGLHDLPFGTFVVRDWAEPPFASKTIWRGHYAVCAVLLVGSVVGVASQETGRNAEVWARLVRARNAILVMDDVVDADVTESADQLLGRTVPAFVTAVAFLEENRVEDESLATRIAQTVMQADPAARKHTAVRVVLVHGYDIGIAHSWGRQVYSHSPSEWDERIARVKNPVDL